MTRYERLHQAKPTKNKKPYRIYLAALLAIILIIWIVVWVKVSEYEKGSTKYLMDKVASDISAEYGGEITYKRAKSVDKGILYNVFKDGEAFATAVLNERDKQGMLGFSLYDIGEVKGSKGITVLATGNEDVKVGGKSISELTTSESGIFLPGLKALAEHKTNKTCSVPQYTQYVLDGQFEKPSIEGTDLALIETKDGTLLAKKMPEKLQKELIEWSNAFLGKYTHYVVYGTGFDNIKDDIFYTSPIYNTVNRFRSLWDYYYDYVLTMHEFNYSDFVQYRDDLVSLRVKYHYTQKYSNKVLENRPDINMYLYKNNGRWQVVEMEISEWTE